MTRSWVTALLGLTMAGVSLAYPWLVVGLYGNRLLLVGLWLSLLALWLARARELSISLRVTLIALACLVAALTALQQVSSQTLAKLYPVVISAALFLVFTWSLLHPPCIIERMVRRTGRDIPPEASRYMRWVTMVWIVFFVANGGVASWLALYGDVIHWAFYNGFLSYILIAAIMIIELLVRRQYQRRVAQGRIVDGGESGT